VQVVIGDGVDDVVVQLSVAGTTARCRTEILRADIALRTIPGLF